MLKRIKEEAAVEYKSKTLNIPIALVELCGEDWADTQLSADRKEFIEMVNGARLQGTDIGDNLDLENETNYPCSDGSYTITLSVDKLLDAQIQAILKLVKPTPNDKEATDEG